MSIAQRRAGAVTTLAVAAMALALGHIGTLPAASAQAVTDSTGPSASATRLELSPARVEVDLDSRRVRVGLTVFNHGPSPRDVEVAVTGLAHDLEGTPQFDAVAPAGLGVAPVGLLRLGPDSRTALVFSGRIPSDAAGWYGGVTVTDADTGGTTGIATRSRVASSFLLRSPGPWDTSISVESVDLARAKDGGVIVGAVVRGTGNVHTRPEGTATVSRAGNVLGTAALPGATVLPGSARRLAGRWIVPADVAPGPVSVEIKLGDRVVTIDATLPPITDSDNATAGGQRDALSDGVGAGPADGPSDDGRVVPIGLLWLAVAVLVAVAAFLLWLWRRRRNRRNGDEATKEAAAGSA